MEIALGDGAKATAQSLFTNWTGHRSNLPCQPLDLPVLIGHMSGMPIWEKAAMGLLNTLFRSVTWWDSQTINTQLYTWRRGVKVGEDEQGNRYFETRNKKRRWVIFNGDAEASRVSADWHGWLHHTYKVPPTETPMAHRTWEKPHQENLTGSDLAYAPQGSMRQDAPKEQRDYQAWQP